MKLFAVYNTNHNCLYVLARDGRQAMSIAYTANHVYNPAPTIAETYARFAEEVRTPSNEILKQHWNAIEGAIAQRIEGTVHLSEYEMSVGYHVVGAIQ